MKDTEIEIKLEIDEEKYNEIIKLLGKELKEKHQIDTYFSPEGNNFFEKEINDEALRIREENNESFFNYKHIIFGENNLDIHIEEYETKIENVEQLIKILKASGINKVLVVDKQRKKYIYKDIYEICLDKVKDLGYFIEIEINSDKYNIQEANKKLLEMAMELKLDISKRNLEGYSNLMYKKIKGGN